MGMYTEIWFRAEIKRTFWPEVTAALTAAVDWDAWYDAWYNDRPACDHPFFSLPRWGMVFRGSSCYFPQPGFFHWGPVNEWNKDSHKELAFQSSLKNYNGEIEAFFDWITPKVDGGPGEFLGYSLYEESNQPVLYHVPGEWY